MHDIFKTYRNAHLWLIIPLVVILLGFTPSYFSSFISEPWGHHMHAISAIAWFILLMIQPYLITRGKLQSHRLWGMIGVFLAGAVVFSALAISPSNVYYGEIGGFPPAFPGPFFYGVILTESLAILGFAFAVIMAIVKSNNTEEHATWMISTVFFAMMPAWGRATMFPVFAMGLEASVSEVMQIAVPLYLAIIAIVGVRLKNFAILLLSSLV